MIERYTLEEMGRIWTEENHWATILEIEQLACEALAEKGLIPREAAKDIRAKASFNIQRIKEIEKTTQHDVIAFLTNVAEYVGDDAKYMHLGMTSSDVLDTALSVQLKQAGKLILERLTALSGVLREKALEYKDAAMMGRTHGIHAEPITFGLKMALWYTENQRNIKRMKAAIQGIAVGKISGAVGTFANIPPFVEEYVCRRLNLEPALVSTQIVQRDRHAYYMTTLAVIASSLDQFATELRHLQRTEVMEIQEPFKKGQKGSSAMPHKRNPILSERICGLARVIRGNAAAALENVALWHERDISHSSAERVILPDSTILLHYLLVTITGVLQGLKVNTGDMTENVERTHGLIFSQRVMLALVEKGLTRDAAYAATQRSAMQAWDEKKEFKALILGDPEVMKYLKPQEVEEIFDYGRHLTNVDYILHRAGILQ